MKREPGVQRNRKRRDPGYASPGMSGMDRNEDRISGDVLAMLGERYDVQELIGEGGIGLVYRGVLRELQLPVALKVLRPEVAQKPEVLARFQREAAAASS